MKLGCHVANSGKLMLEGSVLEALKYGANCFMVYLGAPQNTYRKDVSELKIDEMKELLDANNLNLEDIIIHAPYIVNLAQGDEVKRQFSVDFLVAEIIKADNLGVKYIVLHPGAHVNQGEDVGLKNIVRSLEEILKRTKDTKISIALETMSGKGTELGSKFEHLKYMIEEINSSRLVVCFDSCHTHDSGYDIVNDYEGVMQEFESLIGLDKIKVIHLNDSKNIKGAKKDRHANFGFGEIGFFGLMQFINDPRFKDIPKILETPYLKGEKQDFPPYKYEISMIKRGIFDEDLLNKIMNQA